jgi:hypothetical protein
MRRTLVLALAVALAGCGGGGYLTQWSVASVNTAIAPGPNGALCNSASATVQQIDFSSDTVVTIYQGGSTDSAYYLDLGSAGPNGVGGGATIAGSKTPTGFQFATTFTEVKTISGGNQAIMQTNHTNKTTITVNISGSTLTGNYLNTDASICTDLNGSMACEASGLAKPEECDITADLHGTQLPNPNLRTDSSIPTQGGPSAQ